MSSNVTLSQLKDGAVEELFQQSIGKLLESIADPNTEPEAKREVTIKITLEPSADRSYAAVTVSVASKLPAAIPVKTGFLIKGDGVNLLAHEPIQETIFGAKGAN